jgi:cell division protein FtsZ
MNLFEARQNTQQDEFDTMTPVLKVVGLGGGGSNTINRMIELNITGSVEYIAVNTDAQALESSLAPTKIQIGPKLTRGLGAGGDPRIGEAAAEESYKELNEALAGADMVFLTAGMGGGTGTGAIPIAARVARSLGAVTMCFVTMPFSFEVGRRQKNAAIGLEKLKPYSDTLINVPNDRLLKVAPRDLPIESAFRLADDVLRQGIQGISELITQPGLINVDFSHICNMVQNGGTSLLSIGYGQGSGKTLQAVQQALRHPLLESISLDHASGIIANFTGGYDLTFLEIADALTFLQAETNHQAEIIPGVINDDRMEDRVQVIMVITGVDAHPLRPDKHKVPSRRVEQTPAAKNLTELATVVEMEETTSPSDQLFDRIPPIEATSPLINPDLPAFIRRRVR